MKSFDDIMLLIFDGSSEHDAHVGTETGYLSCLGHLPASTAVNKFNSNQNLFSCIRAHLVLSYHLIYVPWDGMDYPWQDCPILAGTGNP